MIRLLTIIILASLTVSCTDAEDDRSPPQQKEDRGTVTKGARAPVAKSAPVPAGEKIGALSFSDVSDGLPAKGNYAAIAAADLDGDGRVELLSGRREGAEGLFLFRWKAGKWESRQLTESGGYGGVAMADITGDGIPDVLAVKNQGRVKGLELFATRRDGDELHFDPLASPYTDGCDDLDLADFDADGDLDITVSTRGVRVLINAGDGSAFEKIELESGTYEETGIVAADVSGDGKVDILAANHPGKNVRLFLCEATSPLRFSDRHTRGLPLDGKIGLKIDAADFDGDGHADLAIGTKARLRLFMGNSCSGEEASWWKEAELADPGREAIQPVAADLDRDGDVDLVFTTNRGVSVCLNGGGGDFGERLALPALPDKGEYSGCAVVDWDGDGDLDIAVSSFQGNGIRLFENTSG